MAGSSMQKLPAELLASIMLHVDPYSVPMKFALARVSSYWRAVALDSHVLWATFEIDSTAAVCGLPILLQRSRAGSSHDSTPLDVRLTFGYLFGGGDRNRHLLPTSRDAATALLAQPDIAARIAALDITYSSPGALRLLIGADLYFPQLERLHVCRSPNTSHENVHIAITAPRLRHLRIIRTSPRSWSALLVRSLVDVRIEHCGPEAHVGVLATILRQCPSLAHLAFFTQDRAPLGIARDLWPTIRGEDRPVPPLPGPDGAYDSDSDIRSPLRCLSSFRLEVPSDTQNANQILASLADALVVPRTISTCVKTGFFISSTGSLMHSLLRGLAPLDSLSLDTVHQLTLGDELGRERSVRVWDEYGAWEMPDMWRFLAKEYNAHRRVRRFVLNTHAWVALADALAVVPPGSNPPGATNPDPRPPDPRGVELVVRPHYKLIARGDPELTGSVGSSPSESGVLPCFDFEEGLSSRDHGQGYRSRAFAELDEDALRMGLEEADPLAAARASDALVDPDDERLAQGWTTRSLVIPNLRLIKIEMTWAISYAQQRRGVLRVLQWVEPRRNASRSNYSYAPYYAPAAHHTLPSGNGYGYEERTQVCAVFAELPYARDTRPRELRRLAAQLAADGRGFTLCEHCCAIASHH